MFGLRRKKSEIHVFHSGEEVDEFMHNTGKWRKKTIFQKIKGTKLFKL